MSRKIFNFITNYDISKIDLATSITNVESGQRRYYLPNEYSFPSITTVMSWKSKDGIDAWKEKVGIEEYTKIMNKASSRGTAIHDACEKYLLNEENYIDNKDYVLNQSFNDIKTILDNSVDDIYCLEKSLYSMFLGVAGKTDCIAKYNGKKSVIDFKTSRKIKQKKYISGYLMQATAYAIMFEELTGIAIPYITIIMTVDHEGGQVFEEKRDNYVDELLDTIKKYKKEFPDVKRTH